MSQQTQSATERPHVLIVSDDEELSAFLGDGLVYAGFWTSTVASGIQTLEVFRLRSFDVVLIDAALPGMGALEVVRRLRGRSDRMDADVPRTDVPILVVAASLDEVDSEEVAGAGANGLLVAPLDLENLAPHLHHVVGEWRTAHPKDPPITPQ